MKKKLLFVSYYFWPDSSIGAVRPTKFCKYLSEKYDVDVLTAKRSDNKNFYDNLPVRKVYEVEEAESVVGKLIVGVQKSRIYQYFRKKDNDDKSRKSDANIKQQRQPSKNNDKVSLLRKAAIELALFRVEIEDIYYYNRARKTLKKHIINNQYDVMITDYAPMSSHRLGMIYKKNNLRTKWIADFRDPAIQPSAPFGIKLQYTLLMKKIDKMSDYVMTINSFIMEELNIVKSNRVIVSNGYDGQEINDILKNYHKDKNHKLTFLYTGAIYNRKRSLEPVFNAIYQLDECKFLDKTKIELSYAGHDFVLFEGQAKKYGLDKQTRDLGFLTREESIIHQKQADILLLASWNTKKEQGVVTGKYFEYLASGNPIIASVTGDKENSLLKKHISKYNLGYCLEEINYEKDFMGLCEYIKQIWQEYICSGYVSSKADHKFIEQFDHRKLVDKLIRDCEL